MNIAVVSEFNTDSELLFEQSVEELYIQSVGCRNRTIIMDGNVYYFTCLAQRDELMSKHKIDIFMYDIEYAKHYGLRRKHEYNY